MMLITHATHFLTTQLILELNRHNFNYLVAADEAADQPFFSSKVRVQQRLSHDQLSDWLDEYHAEVEFIFHLAGDEPASDGALFRMLWQQGVDHQLPLIFRATPARVAWTEQQPSAPFFWAGLSFTDAFGPGDEGWVPQVYRSLTDGGPTSPRPSEERTMVYSADIAAICYFLVHHRTHSGTHALDLPATVTYEQVIDWVKQAGPDTASLPPTAPAPASLQVLGFDQLFFSPEAGVRDYVQNYL